MTVDAAETRLAKPTRLASASRKQLLLWTVAPWLPIFLVGHTVLSALIGNRGLTLEALGVHAMFTVIGSGALVEQLVRKIAVPPLLVSIALPWAAMLTTELCFLRTRKLAYLIAFEALAGLQVYCGMRFIVAIASV